MNVLGAIITLVVGFGAASWLARLVNRAMRRADKIDPVFQPLPGRIVRVAVIIFTLIAVLNRFGVETTCLIALLGAASLAIGLALQGTLSNVAADLMVLLFRPFKIGDLIKIGGDTYVIDTLGFFACKAHLPDGPSAFLPNAKIWGQIIIKLSVTDQDRRRIGEVYGIGRGNNIDTARYTDSRPAGSGLRTAARSGSVRPRPPARLYRGPTQVSALHDPPSSGCGSRWRRP